MNTFKVKQFCLVDENVPYDVETYKDTLPEAIQAAEELIRSGSVKNIVIYQAVRYVVESTDPHPVTLVV